MLYSLVLNVLNKEVLSTKKLGKGPVMCKPNNVQTHQILVLEASLNILAPLIPLFIKGGTKALMVYPRTYTWNKATRDLFFSSI